MQGLNCVQMRALPTVAERRWVSGCKNHYKFVLGAGAKAKTVTNNLPILSVLGNVLVKDLFNYCYFRLIIIMTGLSGSVLAAAIFFDVLSR